MHSVSDIFVLGTVQVTVDITAIKKVKSSRKKSESCTRFLIEQLSTKCSPPNKNILGVSALIDRKITLPAALRCLHKPEYAEKSIWASRFWPGEARKTAAAHCEAAFVQPYDERSHQQLPVEELSHILNVPCNFSHFDVWRRQMYWHMSLRRMWPGHTSRPFWGCA